MYEDQNAIYLACIQAILLAEPVLGIAVYSATSLGIVLFLDVLGALIANLMLLLTKIHQPKADSTPSAPSFFSEFKLGWKAFIQAKPIVLLIVGTAIVGIAFMPLPTLFPFMTLSHFGRGGYSASVVESIFGIGMILGAILLSTLGCSRLKDISYICISLVGIGLTCVAIGLALAGPIVNKFGVQTWFFWSGIITILTGIFMYVQFKRMRTNI